MALISVATQTSNGTFEYTDMNQILDALKSAGYDINTGNLYATAVGVGTTSPETDLHVGGAVGVSWAFDGGTEDGIAVGSGYQDGRVYVEGSQSAGFILYDSGGTTNERTFSVQQNGGSTKFYLYNDSGTLNTSFMEFDHATPLTSIGTNVDIAGDVFLENNKGLIIKTSGGSNTDLFKLSATNQVQIGSTALTTNAIRMLQAVVFYQEIDNGNSGTADTVAWNAGNMQKSTLTDNVTFTFTAPENVGRFQLKLIQDATGGRTVTWPATVKWAGGTAPTISTAANAVDIATFYYDGTSYYGDIIQDMS